MTPTGPPERTQSDHEEPQGRRIAPWVAIGAVVLVAVAITVVLVLGGDDSNDDGPTPGQAATVSIPAGTDIQPVVDASPIGTTFLLEDGVYRGQQVSPRDGDVFQGAGEGTVLDGATVLDGWTADGDGWSVGGQTQAGVVHGECRADAPRCGYPEELFVDGTRLRHVASLPEVGPGTWFFDYDADRIHIGTDPTGSTVETSVTPFAFRSEAQRVVLRDLVVTHYATQSQYGAIHVEGPDWTIEGVTARDNHAAGIFFEGDRTTVRDSRSLGNGQSGLGATESSDSRVERVELADNNQDGFDDEWEAGGAKFTLTHNQVVVDSNVHGNDGPGIWFDVDAVDSVTTGNQVADNTGAGIYYEISAGGTIADNEVTGNGFGEQTLNWVWGAGIQIAATRDIAISDNRVAGNFRAVMLVQQDRDGSPALGEYRLDGITVTGNTISLDDGLLGAATDVPGSDVYERSLEFRDNTYEVDPTAELFTWNNRDYDRQGWTDLGMS